ncbi:hypothetical protein [Tessaracoccus coleopterorum]|uniref:hypothetical protein n=1 Tax=Tessaracoccus coleopterorum TaxID=2714950 RepID=UPI002F910AB9
MATRKTKMVTAGLMASALLVGMTACGTDGDNGGDNGGESPRVTRAGSTTSTSSRSRPRTGWPSRPSTPRRPAPRSTCRPLPPAPTRRP